MSLKAPSELFLEWLAQRPNDTRVAVAIDPDRFLTDAKVLAKPTIVDPAGREWQFAVFRGDDLAFRLRFRGATAKGRTVIVLTRGADSDEPIDVSCVADILARNEAGQPLDLSVPAFFRRITPKINCPVKELRRFKNDLLARLDQSQEAAEKLIQRWGKPDSWGRGQVAAMVLLAYHPELNLNDVWPDEMEPAEFLAHVVRLLVSTPQIRPQREVVLQIIREAARQQVREHLFWAEAEPEEMAGYLVLRDFAAQSKLQNPATQLAGLQMFSPDLPLIKMEPVTLKVIESLKKQNLTWEKVGQTAEVFLTTKRAAKVLGLLTPVSGTSQDVATLLAQEIPAILRQQLLSVLTGFLAKPSLEALAWVTPLGNHPLMSDNGTTTDTARQCRAGLRLLLSLQRMEQQLAVPMPKFQHADALLDWHVQQGQHLLELELSQAGHCLAEFDDDEVLQQGQQYLFGSDELRPTPESLKGRIVTRMEQLNSGLATFVRQDPEKFGRGARSVRGLLRQHIDVKKIAADTLPGRVWVLVFDGMRLDTWETVVRPLLAEFFSITEAPCFCILPSYTDYARTGLLAGGLPSEWKSYKGNFTQDEAQLFGVNMGLTAQEAKTKLRYVTGADTTKARKKMGFTDKEAALLNVLIYPISDEEAHDFEGDLASFNNTIRAKMLGDKNAGVRGILDDLLKRIGPDDVVVLSSDHGFTELLQGDGVTVAEAEAKQAGKTMEESIRWRYIEGFKPVGMPETVGVPVGKETIWMAVGKRWFMREGTKAMPRYSHGGLSLAEVLVPGAVLRKVTEKTARAELLDLPTILQPNEDTVAEVPFTVRNTGNCDIEFEVRVLDNLGIELLQHRAHLAPATSVKLAAAVTATYSEKPSRETDLMRTLTGVTVRLRHTDLNANWRDALDGLVTIPVKVKPKAVKLEAEALKGFDEV